MTNALTTALVTAGLPDMPMTKRIWLWIQDHPGCTMQDIYKGLKTPTGITGTRISDLHSRKMITRTRSFRNTIKGKVDVFELRVTMKEYELLPRPAKITHPVVAQPSVEHEPAPQPRFAIVRKNSIDIDAMPVGEARALYQKLHAIFGAAK
jgi:hypothetical protein